MICLLTTMAAGSRRPKMSLFEFQVGRCCCNPPSLCCNNSPALHASKIHKLIPFLSKVGSLIKWFLRFEQWDTIYLFADFPHIFNVTFNQMMKHISPHPPVLVKSILGLTQFGCKGSRLLLMDQRKLVIFAPRLKYLSRFQFLSFTSSATSAPQYFATLGPFNRRPVLCKYCSYPTVSSF